MNSDQPHATGLTHQDASGRARMVDVGEKQETERVAIATGVLRMDRATVAKLRAGQTPKGDPLVVAHIAGVQAPKKTADLIRLCHALPLTKADVELSIDDSIPGVRCVATTKVVARTGVEMEALTAVSVALLTVYDMLK